jgi:GWxTD domain-containing protein
VEGQTLWTSTMTQSAGSDLATAVAYVPVNRIALGTAEVLVWPVGARDTSRTPVFVGFAADLPVTTYSDMLSYLEYFTSERRLRELRQAPPQERGEAWRGLMRATDPVSGTPDNEALQAYLGRMRQANGLYAEGGVEGWRTDRGVVLLILGEPDRVLDQFSGDAVLRGRIQQWEYRERNVTIVFEDSMGLNRWRLTRSSEAVLAAERERRQGSS